MKILVPINNLELVSEFVKAGADEFYVGFHDENWTSTFGEYSDINRMSGFGKIANLCSFKDLDQVAEIVLKFGKRLYVTLNANSYDTRELDYIATHYCPSLQRIGIAGVICSDIPTVRCMRNYGLNVTISTMAGVYNQYIAQEYVDLGVERIILPRDLTLEEIRAIVTATSNVEYEVFHMRNGCVFSDPFCLGFHRPECGSTCSFIKHKDSKTITSRKAFAELDSMAFNDLIYNSLFHAYSCAMCAIYDFLKIGISSLKIVGRADDPKSVLYDVSLSVKNLEIAKSCSSRDEYLSAMIMSDKMPSMCRSGLSCYYPEIRYG